MITAVVISGQISMVLLARNDSYVKTLLFTVISKADVEFFTCSIYSFQTSLLTAVIFTSLPGSNKQKLHLHTRASIRGDKKWAVSNMS